MKFFDKWFGPPTRDRFAALFMAALRAAGDGRQPTYDTSEFRLVYGKNNYTNLENYYAEYCAVSRGDRRLCLQRLVRASLSHLKEVPDEFDDAKYDLRPKIWTRGMLEQLRRRQRLEGGTAPEIPSQLIGEHLEACVVYDLPEAMMSVPQSQLDEWGVTFYEALETARQNLESTDFAFARIGEVLSASLTGDNYDASRILLLDLIRRLEVQGDHIAMVPNRDTLLIAGSADDVGLKLMLDIAEKTLSEQPRPMLGMALRLVDDGWVDWLPNASHPLFARFNTLALKYLYPEYAEQKQMLDAIHEQHGIDIFVASFSAVEKPSGDIVSYCLWSQGVDALLPRTQRVVFTREPDGIIALASWERVCEVAGDLLEPTDEYPARFRVREFPSEEQLAAIGKGEM